MRLSEICVMGQAVTD